MDDSLLPTAAHLIRYYNRSCGAHLHLDDIRTIADYPLPGLSREECGAVVQEFLSSPYALLVPPEPYVLDVVPQLARSHELHLMTDRHRQFTETTHAWLRNPPSDNGRVSLERSFCSVYHTGHFPLGSSSLSKAEFARRLDVELFIEDNPLRAAEFEALDIPVLLLRKPWNTRLHLTHPYSRYIENWAEVSDIVPCWAGA